MLYLSGASAFLALSTTAMVANAADHIDAPISSADPAADISDFYAWSRADQDGKLLAGITFASAGASEKGAVYDADVLYGIHIDNDADNQADFDIWVQFGADSKGVWGVRVTGLPGADKAVVGEVGTVIDAGNGLSVFTGQREDPFFFDFQGYLDTLATATVSFDSTRDYFAGLHVTAIVVEIDADSVRGADSNIQTWATTARLK
jgi:hypothetical protein